MCIWDCKPGRNGMVIMEAMDLTLQQAADLLDAYRKEHKLAR